MSFEIDPDRLDIIRDMALGGVCSNKVMDLAYDASKLMGEHDRMIVDGAELELTVVNQHEEEVNVHSNLFFHRYNNEDDNWVEIGFIGKDYDFYLPIVTLNDRSGSEMCSVAVLDPLNASTVQWAESIIATSSDESRPFEKNDGEIQYAASMVDVIGDLMSDINNPEKLKTFAEKFRVNELSRLNIQVDVSSSENQETPLAFLEKIIKSKLATMAVGETVNLIKVVNDSDRLSQSHIVEVNLAKSGLDGIISWDVKFGKPEHLIGTSAPLAPSVILKAKDEGTKFISVDDDLNTSELSSSQVELLESLASEKGYRRVFKLPTANSINNRQILLSDKLTAKNIYCFINESSIEEYSQALSKIIYLINQCPSEVKEPHIDNVIQNFETLLKIFQERFSEEFDLLDLGEISLPEAIPNVVPVFLWGFKNIRADIYAPGWEVFRQAEGCDGSKVRNAKVAFRNSSNISNCSTFSVDEAFEGVTRGDNLYAERAKKAFSNPKSISNCTARKVTYAFSISKNLEVKTVANRVVNCIAYESTYAFIVFKQHIEQNVIKKTKRYRDQEVVNSIHKIGIYKRRIGSR